MKNVGVATLKSLIQRLAAEQLPSRFAVEAGPLGNYVDAEIFPEETDAMKGGHPRRLATFRAGRACARAALGKLGMALGPILVADSGMPVWPEGIAGSISHTDKFAAAIVAKSPPVHSIGLDIEENAPFEDGAMVEIVCRPEELLGGRNVADPENMRRAKLLFCMKEAVYKSFRPLYNRFLDFHDVRIQLDSRRAKFQAELVNHVGTGQNAAIFGGFVQCESLLIVLASSDFITVRE